jgi:hypothetical protein
MMSLLFCTEMDAITAIGLNMSVNINKITDVIYMMVTLINYSLQIATVRKRLDLKDNVI